MTIFPTITKLKRKAFRRLNWRGVFFDAKKDPQPVAVIAGYTRSGTTFLGRLLSSILSARPIHEPLNPLACPETAFFKERESLSLIQSNERYQDALRSVFAHDFRGTKLTNTGSRLVYSGRIIKVVRANHYLGYLSDQVDDCPFVVIVRNPCACISSRMRLGWPVPDHSSYFDDIRELLSAEQVDSYEKADGVVTKLAVSWCLDNFMLMKNAQRPNFLFVNYESVLSEPMEETSRILRHLGEERHIKNIDAELQLEWNEAPSQKYLASWRGHLKEGDLSEIHRILGVFGLDTLYDFESGHPVKQPLFSR